MNALELKWGHAALYAREPRPGMPLRDVNDRARVETDARMAMREWLMV